MPPTEAAHLDPIADYAALLIQSRFEALRALADILATSDDPTERRLAAAAILRAPNPEPPAVRPTAKPPVRTYEEEIAEEHTHQAPPRTPLDLVQQLDPQGHAATLRMAKRLLNAAGIPLDDPIACADLLADFENGRRTNPISPAAHLAATAGQAAPS
jgi:hypothetical protein